MSLRDCTCNCMDCIEGLHCGIGYPNPDGTPTICLYPREDEGYWDWQDEEEDWQERMSGQDFFDLVEGY